MNSVLRIPLQTNPEQHQRLLNLQREFARACNSVAPLVQETRTWNRVTLHHLAYRRLRQAFPGIGSQMACNAIYSVSRAARLVFQSPNSPFHHSRMAGKPLPLLQFMESSPVYFDRHTLSLKQGQASMYTLDGRMRFQLALKPEQEAAFHQRKLLEASLQRRAEAFELHFTFGLVSNVQAHSLADAQMPPATVGLTTPWHAETSHASTQNQDQESKLPLHTMTNLPPYLSLEVPK